MLILSPSQAPLVCPLEGCVFEEGPLSDFNIFSYMPLIAGMVTL
jgi:hypothetical protein